MDNKKLVLDSAARETQFEVDGVSYTLRYGFEAIAAFEENAGFNPVTEPFKPTMLNFISLLFVGLRARQPEIDIQTVQGWFNEKTSGALCKLAWESFFGALPEPSPESQDAPAASVDPPQA